MAICETIEDAMSRLEAAAGPKGGLGRARVTVTPPPEKAIAAGAFLRLLHTTGLSAVSQPAGHRSDLDDATRIWFEVCAYQVEEVRGGVRGWLAELMSRGCTVEI